MRAWDMPCPSEPSPQEAAYAGCFNHDSAHRLAPPWSPLYPSPFILLCPANSHEWPINSVPGVHCGFPGSLWLAAPLLLCARLITNINILFLPPLSLAWLVPTFRFSLFVSLNDLISENFPKRYPDCLRKSNVGQKFILFKILISPFPIMILFTSLIPLFERFKCPRQ